MRNNLHKKGLVFVILMLLSTPLLTITKADVVTGLDPDALPLIPIGAPSNCGYENFENGVDGQEIISTIPGVKFTTTGGYNWVYADVRTGNYNGKYPNGAYTNEGNICAWLGPAQNSGKIDFTEGDASYFSCYVSTYSGAVVDAYKDDGTFICSSGWASNNLYTGKMTLLSVYSPNRDIGYVIVHDTGNYWVLDRVVCDASGVGTPQYPIPKIIIDSYYLGNDKYHVDIKLMNLGEDSATDSVEDNGVQVQAIGGLFENIDKKTFDSYNFDVGTMYSVHHVIDFKIQSIEQNEECIASFTIKTVQGNKAVIGIRAWITDKDTYILNTITNQPELYITRSPKEDESSYNNKPYHIPSSYIIIPGFSSIDYALNYYPLYKVNELNTDSNSIWIGIEWTGAKSNSEINSLLDMLRSHSIKDVYLDIGGADANGYYYNHLGLTKTQVKQNCKNFLDVVEQYNLNNNVDFKVHAMVFGDPVRGLNGHYKYDVREENVRNNIISFCNEFVSADVGFDGIHFDYEFYMNSETIYKEGYITLLDGIKDNIGNTKTLSVAVCPAWLNWAAIKAPPSMYKYVHNVSEIADETVLMAYVCDLNYQSFSEWLMGVTYQMYQQAIDTDSKVIIGISLSDYERDDKGERFDYALVGALMGAKKSGKTNIYISIWNHWDADTPQDDFMEWRVYESIWKPNRIMDVSVFSPVDLHLYDSLGRHVGLNYDTGEIDNEIPGAYYSGPDAEPQKISITNPTDDDYSIVLVGTDQGTYHMKIEGYISDTLVHSEIIEGDTSIGEVHNFGITIPIENPFNLILNVDNSPPNTEKTITEPKYGENDEWMTSTTEVNFTATDDLSGVDETYYRIWYNGAWSSWNEYISNFTLNDEGLHYLEYYSVDNVGNVEEIHNQTHYVDDTFPSITVETPFLWEALQDGVTFSSVVTDSCGVNWVKYAIREPGGLQGTVIDPAYESLVASSASDDKWQLLFDTTQLDDGYYVLFVNASDNLGNIGYTTVNFSIRNWAVLEMLPNTPSSKAGRTMPIKFCIRVIEAVDPTEPFVRNEELTIKIYVKGNPQNILQTSIYGSSSTDYRIDSIGEKYITNFKTLSTPKTYVVDIWRDTVLIGGFEFATVK